MSVIKQSKMGLGKGNGNMSTWQKTDPGSYKPESSPAKPGGGSGAGRYASKTAATPSVDKGMVSGIQRRF